MHFVVIWVLWWRQHLKIGAAAEYGMQWLLYNTETVQCNCLQSPAIYKKVSFSFPHTLYQVLHHWILQAGRHYTTPGGNTCKWQMQSATSCQCCIKNKLTFALSKHKYITHWHKISALQTEDKCFKKDSAKRTVDIINNECHCTEENMLIISWPSWRGAAVVLPR